jgi:hypothetical protein
MHYLINKETGEEIERIYQIDADEAVKLGGFIEVNLDQYKAFKADPKAEFKAEEKPKEAEQTDKKSELKKMVEEIQASKAAADDGVKVNGRSGEKAIREMHEKYCSE